MASIDERISQLQKSLSAETDESKRAEIEARIREITLEDRPVAGRHPDSVPGVPTRDWDAYGLSTSPPPSPPMPRDRTSGKPTLEETLVGYDKHALRRVAERHSSPGDPKGAEARKKLAELEGPGPPVSAPRQRSRRRAELQRIIQREQSPGQGLTSKGEEAMQELEMLEPVQAKELRAAEGRTGPPGTQPRVKQGRVVHQTPPLSGVESLDRQIAEEFERRHVDPIDDPLVSDLLSDISADPTGNFEARSQAELARMRAATDLARRNTATYESMGREGGSLESRDAALEHFGLPSREEMYRSHGQGRVRDPAGSASLGGRMARLEAIRAARRGPPPPPRLTPEERGALFRGTAGEDLIGRATANDQFSAENIGAGAPGDLPSGSRIEDMGGGRYRSLGARRARLEDLLSEADYAESVEGDTAGAAGFLADAQGIRDDLDARRVSNRAAVRRARNARSLTDALAMRERSRPGGVTVSGDEQAMIEGLTPAQRDRLTIARARAGGRGRRDMDRRESQRQAWNAEALRRGGSSLLDSVGGRGLDAQKLNLEMRRLDATISQARTDADDARSRGDAVASQRHDEHAERMLQLKNDAAERRQRHGATMAASRDELAQRGRLTPIPETPEERLQREKQARIDKDKDRAERENENQNTPSLVVEANLRFLASDGMSRQQFDEMEARPTPAPAPATGPPGTQPGVKQGRRGGLKPGFELNPHATGPSTAQRTGQTPGETPTYDMEDPNFKDRQRLYLDDQLKRDIPANRQDGSEGLESLLLKDLYSLNWRTPGGSDWVGTEIEAFEAPLEQRHAASMGFGDAMAHVTSDDFAKWVISQPKYSGRITHGMAREFYATHAPDGSVDKYDWHTGWYNADPDMPNVPGPYLPLIGGGPAGRLVRESGPEMQGVMDHWVPAKYQDRLQNLQQSLSP